MRNSSFREFDITGQDFEGIRAGLDKIALLEKRIGNTPRPASAEFA
jgi:hypothetical protein